METESTPFDVIVVGYGPTGLTLASLLGQRGHRVAIVERWPQLYGKPRLTHIDGETARLISVCADADHALREAWTTPHYNWINGKGQLLMDVAQGNTRKMLWDDHISVHQPHIEQAIHERVSGLPNVRLYRGWIATELTQDEHGVSLSCTPWRKGDTGSGRQEQTIRLCAQYLVGADGSKSFVRQALNVDRHDFGFNERWLCVDTEPIEALPAKFNENAVQVCDPKRGYMFMPIGRNRQRFEFALLSRERTEDMQSQDVAFELLKQYHGIERHSVRLIRNLVYTFECRLARTWRVGRVFLAGDAAHTNPPYLGQGACSGMRDGANLAWKLDLVLRSLAGSSLLDTYEAERRPHAQTLMLDARSLGLVANTANPVKAAIRDLLFKLKLTPKPKFPIVTTGILLRDAAGKPVGEAGTLPPQGRVTVAGRTMRFDEHTGFNFALVVRGGLRQGLSAAARGQLESIGARIVEVGAAGAASPDVDADGVYWRYLDAVGADAALIRPDFVLFGSARGDGLEELVGSLMRALQAAVR